MATTCFQDMLAREAEALREPEIEPQFRLVENDTTNLQLNLEQDLSNGALTKAEMHIKYIVESVVDDEVVTTEEIVTVNCEVVDEENGIVWTKFQEGDLRAGGPFRVEFELEFYDGTIETLNRDIEENLLYLLVDKEIN